MTGAATRADLQALQGRWRQVAFERDGVDDPPDDHGAPGSLTIISGDRYQVFTAEGDLILEGAFVLDAEATPKTLTFTDDVGPKGRTSLVSTYRVEGDEFAFIAALGGGPRPVEFKTREGQVMRRFRRER